MSDFRIRRKPRRDIDIYDYYHPDDDKPKKEEKKGNCPYCGGTLEKTSEVWDTCTNCGRNFHR